MEKQNIYKDISTRTGGDIYIGIVGPVRTGKSTFIKKFMDTMVLPNMQNQFEKDRLIDEMPQSSAGKTIMTTQPKFVPNEAVTLNLKDNATLNVRMIDCVGYMVDGAMGHMEDDKPRMVSTPWQQDPIPFDMAADIGTKKVITDHSTVGIVITTDGTITDLPRESYKRAEERAINELKGLGKPFAIVLNTTSPKDERTLAIQEEMQDAYGMPVMVMDITTMDSDDLQSILETILYDFPIKAISFNLPSWINALPSDHWLMSGMMTAIKETLPSLHKMRDHMQLFQKLSENDDFSPPQIDGIALGKGRIEYNMEADKKLFYKVMEEESGYKIENDYHLLTIIKDLVYAKNKYDKIKNALESSYSTGYGVVSPSLEEIDLEPPQMLKQGNKYAVKLFAKAPSIHLIRTDVNTEVCPIIGTEKQSSDVLDFLNDQFEENKDNIWQANIFGKSLQEVVNEGLAGKNMPEEAREKLQKAMQKMANQGKGHLICFVI